MKLIGLEDLAPYLDAPPDESPNIRPASEYVEQVIDRFYGETSRAGARLPWGNHEHKIVFRPGEMTLWLGVNGHGKSLLLNQLVLSWMQTGDRSCIASFEMKPDLTLKRMCCQASTSEEPTIKFIRDFHAWTDDRLWMYDQQGTVNHRRVLSVGRYFAEVIRGQHVIVDSLLKCGIAEDDYNTQKKFIDELTAVARDTGLHIHLVHHSRKLDNEREIPGKMDAKGSGAITDQVDNCVTFWRNKKKEHETEKNNGIPDDSIFDALMIVDKQRNGDWEGRIPFWFNAVSMTYQASARVKPEPMNFVEEYSEEF
jgi:twinkle protein